MFWSEGVINRKKWYHNLSNIIRSGEKMFDNAKGKKKELSYIKSAQLKEGVLVVVLTGTFTHDSVPSVKEEFAKATRDFPPANILFDLKEVESADTAGIAVLVDLLKHMHDHHGGEQIGLLNPSEAIKFMRMADHVDGLFKIYSSEQDALKDLK